MTTAQEIYSYAISAGAKWPELVVAQWHLESAQGTAVSGENNFFGLKGIGSMKVTNEYVNGKKITIKDQFIDFESPQECVNYLVERWYKDWKSYKGVNRATSAKHAAQMLQDQGYATDPRYAQKLGRLLEQYDALSENRNKSMSTEYVNLVDVPGNFKGLDHQVTALRELQASLSKEQHAAFTKKWRSVAVPQKPKFPLDVPYFYQRDSKTGHGERMCQSSAIAMRIKQIDPKLIGDDDSYIKIVHRYGDTVSQSAHQKALAHLGLKATFAQNGTEKRLHELLDSGIAVPIGILHKGSISNPTGGGHWITLIGHTDTHFYCHDPFGELDLLNGGYPLTGPTDGKCQLYSKKNLMKRWLIASKSDGWLWIINK